LDRPNKRKLILKTSAASLLMLFCAFATHAQGKTPIILIPGLTGSELINSNTGEKVWFKTSRSKTDDLRLPIGPDIAANHDTLVAGDILRDVKSTIFPRTDVYGGLLAALQQAGYREARWDAPPDRGYEDAVYVFPYDWRRDNVETARLLIRKIEALDRKLARPNLKFDVLGHSMGGLIARYAAMYGDADLPKGKPLPTWAGAKYFDKIILLGTPNQGSIIALKDLIYGADIVGISLNLPFVQNLSKFDVFTIPAAFELLPAPGTLRAFDDELNPIKIDIYNPGVWSDYGWNAADDKEFAKQFVPEERRVAQQYFRVVLDRAKRFHEALSAHSDRVPPVAIETLGGECKDTLDGLVLIRRKDGTWNTLFKAENFTSDGGKKVTAEEVRKAIFAPGDGTVTRESLLSAFDGKTATLGPAPALPGDKFVCEEHNKLPRNPEIQTDVIAIFSGGKK
jgi:pimeloyl-ACP methyl ester carboxylesterase